MTQHDWSRRGLIIAASGPLLLAACAREQTMEQSRYRGPPLPRPQRIFVPDLGLLAGDVKLDDGVRARLMQELSSEPAGEQRLAAGRAAAGAVTQEIVSRLVSYGLPAERTARPVPGLPVPNVVVEGHVLSVDQGNRTRRTIIGFGAGQSQVVVEIQVYFRDGVGSPRLIDQFESAAESPRTPGAAATMGAGAAAARAAEAAAASGIMRNVSEARSADTGAEGRRVGDALALRLGQLFAQLGWVSPSAVQ
jgi:hypothetical protein